MICEHGVLGMSVRRYWKRCPQSHIGQSGSHAIRQQTLVHAEHPHPHIYIRKRWPGNLNRSVGLVVSESSDGGSAAHAAFRKILNWLGQAS
jgi:hypothetical protein